MLAPTHQAAIRQETSQLQTLFADLRSALEAGMVGQTRTVLHLLVGLLSDGRHGPNAFQGERKRDLRRLSRRYREDINKVFLKTVLNGRPEKGMPPWKDIVEEEELWKIFTFLKTVQK